MADEAVGEEGASESEGTVTNLDRVYAELDTMTGKQDPLLRFLGTVGRVSIRIGPEDTIQFLTRDNSHDVRVEFTRGEAAALAALLGGIPR